MQISPALALFIDFLATLLVQCGYIWQKKGHMGVENTEGRKNGFCTCYWWVGFITSTLGALLHAGKYNRICITG